MLTLQAVRDHLRIDAGDDDAVLKIYVAAAVQAAEKFTGRRLTPGTARDVYESPEGQSFRLKAEPSGPITAKVHMGGRVQSLPATRSGNRAQLPVFLSCGVERVELIYPVGPLCAEGSDVVVVGEPMIELGVLKFVAHAWTHRGDSPNCWASDSGAASLWSSFRTVAFG